MRTLGCDPGLYGAIACWDDDLEVLVVRDAPIAHVQVGASRDRAVLLDAEYARLVEDLCPDRMVIEEVNGITKQSASASFNFGASFGLLRGFAAMAKIPVYFVPPIVWRTRLRVRNGKDGSRLRAMQLYPAYSHLFKRVKDDGRAEAALLARCPL